MLKKLLLVSNKVIGKPSGGREMLSLINRNILKKLYSENILFFDLDKSISNSNSIIEKIFYCYIDGLSSKVVIDILDVIKRNNVLVVFVDGSNLGGFISLLKQTLPHVEVITFFHNVESRFFIGSLYLRKSVHALGVLLVNFFAERMAVKFSDRLVCLSLRDSSLLKKFYGKGATHISAMALTDIFKDSLIRSESNLNSKYALFVGSNFYANTQGISWFVQNVVPHINIKICIVGKGFDLLRPNLDIPGKVEVIGAVESLADWYRNAQFVIAPIFDGSGMKTKVAEAMMFGKKVIGTPEAFSGYEQFVSDAGWCCNSADDFVSAILEAQQSIKSLFYQEIRNIYIDNYSMDAATMRFKEILF